MPLVDAPDFHRRVFCFLGLPFDAVGGDEAIDRLRAAMSNDRRCLLVTPNTNFVTIGRRNPAFRDSILGADLSTADGMPIVWLARWLGMPVRERVSGADMFDSLLDATQGDPFRANVFLFGGPEGVADVARDAINASAGLRCVGALSPGYGTVETLSDDRYIEAINDSGAHFLVVALGAEKGHAWIERNRDRLRVPAISHLGAVINFTAGHVRRAPGWMRSAGLEWLWRMREEPALWRRYLADGSVLLRLFLTRLLPYRWFLCRRHHALARQRRPAVDVLADDTTAAILRLSGSWHAENLDALREAATEVATRGRGFVVDLDEVTYLDSAAIGLLMLLRGHAMGRKLPARIEGASPLVRRIFEYNCAEYLLEPPRARDGVRAEAVRPAPRSA